MSLDRASVDRTVAIGREVVALVRSEQVSFLAAGIAYYAFVSVFPLLFLILAVGSIAGGEDFAANVVAAAGPVLSPVGQEVVRDALLSATGRAPGTVASVVLLAWSGLKVFRGLDVAFSLIYGTAAGTGTLDQIRDAVVALGAVGLAVVAVVAAGVVVVRTGVVVAAGLGTVVLVVVLAVVFFPLYYLFPDREVSAAAVLPGTVVASIGWTVLGAVFGVYADLTAGTSIYGVLGAVLLLITWFYVGSLALLAGATLNAVLAGTTQTGNDKGPPDDTQANERYDRRDW